MNHMKRFALAISLTVVLVGTAFAGETNSPPCANPGETNSPPCSATQLGDDSVNETTSVATGVEVFLLEATTDVIETLLTVF
jgi:hypothetical protein